MNGGYLWKMQNLFPDYTVVCDGTKDQVAYEEYLLQVS